MMRDDVKIALLASLCVFMLSGCASNAERATVQCESYGFVADTADFSNCLMLVDLARQQRKAAFGAAIAGGSLAKPTSSFTWPNGQTTYH